MSALKAADKIFLESLFKTRVCFDHMERKLYGQTRRSPA